MRRRYPLPLIDLLRLACVKPALLALAALFAATANAEKIPNMQTVVAFTSVNQSASSFLSQFFGQMGVPVVVAPDVSGTVNGSWNDTAERVYQRAKSSLQLVTYYDGIVAYVYNMNDLARVVLPVSRTVARKIIAQADGMDLPDQNHRLSVGADSGLVVTGTPRFIELIREISYTVRQNTKKYVPLLTQRLFKLKHSWAHDTTMNIGGESVTVPGVVSILNELVNDKPMEVALAPRLNSGAFPIKPLQKSAATVLSTGSQPGKVSGDNTSAQRTAQVGSDVLSDVRIVAVPNLNAVLIRDLETRMDGYQSLIDSLDTEPYMLEIEATIIDLDSSRSAEFGVNWRLQGDDGNEALLGDGTVADQLLRPNTNITPQGEGGILSLAIGNQAEKFLARIRALEKEGDAEIISKPHVVTLANTEAILDTNQTFFVRVAGVEEAELFRITAGTTLRVTPHVYRVDGEARIKLKVDIKDGATTDATVDEIPVIGESSIRTTAIIAAGDSLLVGGLVRESKQDLVTKIPLLGDLPGLGSMFRSTSRSGRKVERLFLITPRLAYSRGFSKRLDAPVLQGQINDIINTSAKRRAAATDTLTAVSAQRQAEPAALPVKSPNPVIAPIPKRDLLLAGDGQPVDNGAPTGDGGKSIVRQLVIPVARSLRELLVIPPPPASGDSASTLQLAVVPAQKTPASKPRFTVQAMPPFAVTTPVQVQTSTTTAIPRRGGIGNEIDGGTVVADTVRRGYPAGGNGAQSVTYQVESGAGAGAGDQWLPVPQ